jgi:hypothetical protein
LDGSGSFDDDEADILAYAWITDCPGGSFDDGASPMPTLTVASANNCNLVCNVRLTVTDISGASDEGSTSVTIVDTEPPTLIGVPSDVTVECDSVPPPASVTVSDVCDQSPTISFTETRTDGNCSSNYTINRTWSGTDRCGNTASATQVITVQDTTPPVISCNSPATIIPPDAPITFTSESADNCDELPTTTITDYDCYKFTKKGKRIDKTKSCIVNVTEDQITILDSGGVNDHITWTVEAIDECGNKSFKQCEVLVVNPAK